MRSVLLGGTAIIAVVCGLSVEGYAATCSPLYSHPAVEEVIEVHVGRVFQLRRTNPSAPYNVEANVSVLRERINKALNDQYVRNPEYVGSSVQKVQKAGQAVSQFNFDTLVDCFPGYRPVVMQILDPQLAQRRQGGGYRNLPNQQSSSSGRSDPIPTQSAPEAQQAAPPPAIPAPKAYSEMEARTLAEAYDACLKTPGNACSAEKAPLVEMLTRKGMSSEEVQGELAAETSHLVQKLLDSQAEAYRKCVKPVLERDLADKEKLFYLCANEQAAFSKLWGKRGVSAEELKAKLAAIEDGVRDELAAAAEAKRKAEEERAQQAKLAEEQAKRNAELAKLAAEKQQSGIIDDFFKQQVAECPKATYRQLLNGVFTGYTTEFSNVNNATITINGKGLTLNGNATLTKLLFFYGSGSNSRLFTYTVTSEKSGAVIEHGEPEEYFDKRARFMNRLCTVHFKE